MDTTPCIRCGKPRIISKTWTEKSAIFSSSVTYTESVCPDPECQKIVNKQLKEKRQFYKQAQAQSLKKKLDMKRKRTDIVLGRSTNKNP